MPLITDLKNVAMRSRHWQQIREDLGRSFDEASAEFTLERIVEFGFDTHAEFINQVSSSASKELIIETVSVTYLHTHSLQYMHILSFSLSLTHTHNLSCVQELANMQSTWNTLELDIVPYKDKGHFKVRNTDEAFQALDDHQTKLGTITALLLSELIPTRSDQMC